LTWQYIEYEIPLQHVARIWLNRPEAANAQDTRFLYELNEAMDRAARDDEIHVIIVAARGKHFSAGHDTREFNFRENQEQWEPVGNSNQQRRAGAEGRMSREEELYGGLSERWRNLPKPTIAAVQGKCIAGGLLICWPCDLIIASDDAQFQDVTVAAGIAGCEWFAYPWEVGTRKAKEMLLTGDPINAEEARQLGMVNRVVPRDRLDSEALDLAAKIARQPTFATRLVKLAVNSTQDTQGRHSAFQTAFALHQLAHSHWVEIHGVPVVPNGLHASGKQDKSTG